MTPTDAYRYLGVAANATTSLRGLQVPTVDDLLAKIPQLSDFAAAQSAAMGRGLTRGQRFAQLRASLEQLPGTIPARSGQLAREFAMRLVIELDDIGALNEDVADG